MIRLSERRFRRLVVILMLPLLILSSMWATLYISVETDATLEVPEEPYSLQLMAADYNPDGERVLQKDGGMHRLDLGSWVAGTNKTFPAAFAIVNPSDRPMTIEGLNLKGTPEGVQLYLHRNMTRPSNEDLVNIDKVEDPADTTKYYDDGPTDVEEPWELRSGDGYDENDDLIYQNDIDSVSASTEDGVWVHDFGTDKPLVADERANFVWVEISVVPSVEMDSAVYRGSMEIEIEAEFEDGPTMTFMGAGRRDGGPTIRAKEGNSIELNVTDLKEDTTVVIPDAFAIVNAGSSEFKVTGVEVNGDTEGYMRVYLHGDPYAPTGDYDIPVDGDDSGIIYYDGSNEDLPEGDGWGLNSGLGYDDDSDLIYGNESANSTATRTAGHTDAEHNLWMYDTEGNNTATEGECNFVWVEIAYVIPEDVDDISEYSAEITFQLSSV